MNLITMQKAEHEVLLFLGVKAMFTPLELFDLALQVEDNGERFYRYALGKVKSDSLRNLLSWLADQEALHKISFKETRERIAGEGKPVQSFPSLTQQVLRSAMGRHAFSLDELQIDSLQDEQQILQAALDFEEDTMLFFDFISPFITDPGASAILEEIKTEESNHRQLLTAKISEFEKKNTRH